jgi:hypothetical protein
MGGAAVILIILASAGLSSVLAGSGNTRTDAFVISQRGKAIHAVVSEATTSGEPILLQAYADFESLNAR